MSLIKALSLINKIHDKHNLLLFTLLNISDIYKFESCKLIHRFNNKVIPKPLNKLFKKPPHDHITRQIECNSVGTLVFDQALSPIRFYGPLTWNQNCLDLHHLSLKTFAKKLKTKFLGDNM